MGWLDKIFSGGGDGSKAKPESKTYRAQDDSLYNENDDILDGMRYAPPLQLRIPLDVISRYGEMHRGPYSTAPRYHELDFWVPQIKKEYALDVKHEAASDIGPVNPNEYIPQLIKFRKIIESDKTDANKIAEIDALGKRDKAFEKYLEKWRSQLADFPYMYLGLQEIIDLPGVGRKTARALYFSGFTSIESITGSAPEELEKIEGIGEKTAKKIHETAKNSFS